MTNVTEQTPNTETGQSSEDVPTSEVAKKCLDLVETYRRSERKSSNKAGSTREIITALAATMPELSKIEFNDSLGTYLSMLEQHDQSIADSWDGERERGPETEENVALGSKRAASLGTSNATGKKPKQDDTDFPWTVREQISDCHLGDSLESTLKLLRAFARDLKFTKSSVINSVHAPPFPHSEWSNIIKSLGASLRAFRQENGDHVELIMHKSDIQGAYRNIPMAPLWQIKQAVAFEDRKHIDGCNCFGCHGSYYVYLAFISLVCWIAHHVKMIPHLKCYIDDNCSFACLGDVKYYPPYKCYFPTDQTKLLELWDELGLPHEHKKQIYGPIIPFIGFDVDPNAMTVSISCERKQSLVDKVLDFAKSGKHRSLKDYQSLAGHINWSLAVFPLLKPCLSAMYTKMTDKSKLLASIRVNNAVRDELLWFAKHALKSDGIFFLKAVAWDPSNDLSNTLICYTDACPTGMAYWFPELRLGFQCRIPETSEPRHIFYFEALAITCAVLDRSTTPSS